MFPPPERPCRRLRHRARRERRFTHGRQSRHDGGVNRGGGGGGSGDADSPGVPCGFRRPTTFSRYFDRKTTSVAAASIHSERDVHNFAPPLGGSGTDQRGRCDGSAERDRNDGDRSRDMIASSEEKEGARESELEEKEETCRSRIGDGFVKIAHCFFEANNKAIKGAEATQVRKSVFWVYLCVCVLHGDGLGAVAHSASGRTPLLAVGHSGTRGII